MEEVGLVCVEKYVGSVLVDWSVMAKSVLYGDGFCSLPFVFVWTGVQRT